MAEEFLLGCQWMGLRHHQDESVESQFRMVRDAGVYDHLDRLPPPDLVDEYLRWSEHYSVPVRTGTGAFAVGRDEAALEQAMRNMARLGGKLLNIMLLAKHGSGRQVTDDEVVDCYQRVWEMGDRVGVQPSFEVHVDTWAEEFRRVIPVAERVRALGLPFNFTLDYSHCVFKIDNPQEQEVSGVREDVEAGRIVLDPFEAGSLCERWLEMNIVKYAQYRPAVPNGPRNVWATDDQGRPGRGIQYPFLKPHPGEWHSPWQAWKLEPSKQAIRKVLSYHLTHPDSPLRFMNTEMIVLPDYGANAKYSLYEHNVAVAHWIRETWAELKARQAAGVKLI